MDIIKLMLLSRQIKNRRREKNNKVSGIPPLTFTAKNTGALKNYRIYGDTVNGESVGDRTGNLFDGELVLGSFLASNGSYAFTDIRCISEFINVKSNTAYSLHITGATITHIGYYGGVFSYSSPKIHDDCTFVTPNNCTQIRIVFSNYNDLTPIDLTVFPKNTIMLNEGSMPLPYEPYGYKVPVTICGENLFRKSEIEYNTYLKEDGQIHFETVPPGFTSDTSQYISIIPGETYTLTRTGSRRVKFYGYDKNPLTNTFDVDATNSDITFIAPQNAYYIRFTINHSISLETVKLYVSDTALIYLDAPLTKSGNIADYIDYAAQKRYNADGTESSVTLPEIAVTAGTNTFTVGTEVQPSRVELTGRIKEAQTNGSGNT